MFKINKRKISINKTCRACLAERAHLRELFSTKIPRMLETISSVQLSDDDGLPSNICISCFHLIRKFYTFKKKIERSDKILRSHCKKIKEDIAVSDAQNDAEKEENNEQHECETTVMSDNSILQEENSGDQSITDYTSDDDPLSECVQVKPGEPAALRKINEKKLKKTTNESSFETEMKKDHQKLSYKDSKSHVSKDVIENLVDNNGLSSIALQLFTEGPPPLIPLEPKAVKVPEKFDSARNLPHGPPPLIPIKPIVNPENILKQPVELKLSCSSCTEEFSSTESLKQHKLNECSISMLQCNICKKEFKERIKLIEHLKGHIVVNGYGCEICGKRYPNPCTFKVHMRSHTGERPFECEVCGKGFTGLAGVACHMKTHQDHKPYRCPTCGKGFKISSNLERHKIIHSGILPYCCNYCDKTFSQSQNLQLHIRTYHTNERPYLCNKCGGRFFSSTRLNQHMRVHTGCKPYLCKSCPKVYVHLKDLRKHERTSHSSSMNENNKTHICEVCHMCFTHQWKLNKHTKTHNGPHNAEDAMMDVEGSDSTHSNEIATDMEYSSSSSDEEDSFNFEEVLIKREELIIEEHDVMNEPMEEGNYYMTQGELDVDSIKSEDCWF